MKTLGLCIAAIALSISSAAVAQNYQGYGRNGDNRSDSERDRNDRGRGGRYDNDHFDNIRGRTLPREHLRGRFEFAGWKERGLKKPAHGQEWAKICDPYMLVSARIGNVAEVYDTGKGRVDQKRDWRLCGSFRCMR